MVDLFDLFWADLLGFLLSKPSSSLPPSSALFESDFDIINKLISILFCNKSLIIPLQYFTASSGLLSTNIFLRTFSTTILTNSQLSLRTASKPFVSILSYLSSFVHITPAYFFFFNNK